MRFSVDAHAIGRNLTGNEVYVRNLLKGFAALDSESDFIVYLSEPNAAQAVPDRFASKQVSRNPFVRLGWDLSRRLREDQPDLVHVQYTAPLNCPSPIVVSVHDVSFLEHPEYFRAARVWQLQVTVRRTVQRAARILTPSEFSSRQIQKVYGVDPDKITVVPNAVSAIFRPMVRETARAQAAHRFGIPAPYVLTVGDLQPRKNQVGLIAAFEQLIRERPELPHHLVLTGQDSWFAGRVHEAARRSPVGERIHFTGFVRDEELLTLYGGCDIFVFPSFYEGFGLPIIEAMACGRAVACSNVTATVEVADGAGITFDPSSTGEIARAMRDLLLDHELRGRMERLGIQRAHGFQWKDAAAKTLDVYYDVAGKNQPVGRRAGAGTQASAAARR
jgi:glycosyltransferase involved in cell wall biosynthesis